MTRKCVECDSELTYHDSSCNWECPNPICYVSHIVLKKIRKRGQLFEYAIERVVYVAVL